MFHTFAFCSLCCWNLVGVFGDTDTVKSVSVKEGDSVTLQINVTEIQTDDKIDWKFGTNKILIVKIRAKTSKIFDGPDGRFRDRLKLDHQTGSLIITNTRTTDSGLYEVKISSSSSEDTHRFNVTVNGVFGDTDTVKSVSVKEGDSVTLQINVTEIQTDDKIDWKFGTNKILIVKIRAKTSKIFDGPDGRFRDRLKLDHQTGSLIITDTRTTDSGLYEVKISSNRSEDTHRFNVTVNDFTFCQVPEAVTRLVISALVGVAAAFIVVYDITSRKAEQEKTAQTSSSSSSSVPHR
uniref:Immunoglobulin domain-containing protein n=1 Tax=Cyprinus carpio carpio TaxID=630221 RepID=A0A8C1C7Q0_CYPCA